MKLLTVVAGALVAAACSESILPTELEIGLSPRFEIAVVQGGCPTPFTLGAPYDADGALADRNNDGLACYLAHERTVGDLLGIFGTTWTDNNVPFSQIGGCPNGFELDIAPKKDPQDFGDINGDGFICRRLTGNGSYIVIDNNHRS